MLDRVPIFQPIWCACKACGHWWDDWQPSNVPPATWIAHIKTLHCPNCGKGPRSIRLRSKPLSEKPDDRDAA